jgi:PD-(D/E)XK endonuclease
MRTPLPTKYTWTDEALTNAVKGSACWRDVIRALGIATNSEGTMRRVRRDVSRLALDVSHFKATRTWDDAQLKRAVAEAMSWDDVFASLGLRTLTKETRARVEGHAIRLGLDVKHLIFGPTEASDSSSFQLDPIRLRDAATPLAAAWFMMRGCTVSFPMEQAVYDLLVHSNEQMLRIQVKTTTASAGIGTVNVARRPYSAQNLGPRMPYDARVIDYFFIVDGDHNIYLIPSRVIAGRVGLGLRTYRKYIVGNAVGLLGPSPSPSADADAAPGTAVVSQSA